MAQALAEARALEAKLDWVILCRAGAPESSQAIAKLGLARSQERSTARAQLAEPKGYRR